MEQLCWEERLAQLGLFTWTGEALGSPHCDLAGPEGETGNMERDNCQGMEGQDTENGFKMAESEFEWDFGNKFFPVRVGRSWHRVPRAAVAAPESLAVPKARLGIGVGAAWDREGVPAMGGVVLDVI
ncbi:hypothetical protein HGM15179_014114 [Zosterops borbonicus]|uniref:Uncharacterized protein n=1 Tax=Zosterops borbonicus TaxID=364589 RepID=A0A8K1LGC8_9PASS|nr:hypothetical protein HGM15179_014114 [Zosterops borbonicus]